MTVEMAKRGCEQIKTRTEICARAVKRRQKNTVASGMPAANKKDDDSELGLDRIANYTDNSVPEHVRYWLA